MEGCEKIFSHKGRVQKHVASIHFNINSEKVVCPIENCERLFANEANLKRHITSIHNNHSNKTYLCPVKLCEKVFKRRCSINKHISSIHIGEIFPCSECDYKATWKGYLKNHIEKMHKGPRL